MAFRTPGAGRLAVLLAALLATAVVAHPAAAEPAGDWTAAPASSGDGGGRPHFYLEGDPGAVLEDTVSVTNPGTEPLRVTLRGADAYNKRDGSFAIRSPDESKEAGAWLAFAEDVRDGVTVPPRTRADIPFTVTVPADAAPGDHPGAIVAEAGREVGIRMQLRVSGPTLAAVGVEDVEVADDKLRYVLVNRGSTALTPRLAVRAEGFYGDVLRHGPRKLDVELLPGQRAELAEPWPGTSALDSVDIELTATAPGGARDTATASYGAFPWGTALLVLAGASALALLGWRRRRRPAPVPPPGEAGPQTEDPAAAQPEPAGAPK